MNSPYVITNSEAQTLRAFNDYGSANIYELASAAKLTASEINTVVSDLVSKRLARLEEPGRNVALTSDGLTVRRSLSQPNVRRSYSFGYSPDVTIVPDDLGASPSFSELSADDLDAALDEAIEKLK